MKFRLGFIPRKGEKYEVFDESIQRWGGKCLVEVIRSDMRNPRTRFLCKIVETPVSGEIGLDFWYRLEQFAAHKRSIGVYEI